VAADRVDMHGSAPVSSLESEGERHGPSRAPQPTAQDMSDPSLDSEIRRLEEQYAAHPGSLIFARLADLLRKRGEPERALEVLAAGLEDHPAYLSAHIVRARTFLDLGREVQAEGAYRDVLDLDEQNLVALGALAATAEMRGDEAAALGWYERLLRVDPRNEEAEEAVARLSGVSGQAPSEPWPEETLEPEPEARDALGLDVERDETPVSAGEGEESFDDEPKPEGLLEPELEREEALEPPEAVIEQEGEEGRDFGATWSVVEEEEIGPSDVFGVEAEPGAVSQEPLASPGWPWDQSESEEAWEEEATAFDSPFPAEAEAEVELAEPEPEPEWEPELEAEEEPEPEPEAEGELEAEVEPEPEPEAELEPEPEPEVGPVQGGTMDLPTETLATLYATQGLYREAVDIYEELVRRRPHDEALAERLRAARDELAGGEPRPRTAGPHPSRPLATTSGLSRREEPSVREHLRALLRGEAAPMTSERPSLD
jgi:tetratricopeptide (TPR) repeat protein